MRLVLAWLAMFVSSVLYAETESLKFTRELGLTGYQEDLLGRDAPLTDIALSSDARVVYVLGQTHVWLWRPEARSLHRVKIPRTQKDGACSDLETVGTKQTVLACDGALYLVELEPLRLLRLRPPSAGESHGYGIAKDAFYWLHDSGIFATTPAEPNLKREFGGGLFQRGDLARYAPSSRTVWIARGPLLLKKSIQGDKVKSEPIHKAAEDFVGLTLQGEEAWAHTRTTVLRFDGEGRLLSVVPVEGRRLLADARFTPSQHVYLFEDGLLEVYDLVDKKRRGYRLEKNWDRVSHLASEGPLTAFLRDGKPALFLLE